MVVLTGFIAGCDDKYKDPDPQAMGYGYYPLEVGDYRIYNVTDIRFRFNVSDTTRVQLMERVDTTFYDQTNTLNYKIVRSVRPGEGSLWVEDSVFVVAKQPTMVTLTKDNTKYVKLVFPVKSGASWLGDAFNDRLAPGVKADSSRRSEYYLGKESYIYHNKGVPFQVNGDTYGNTVTVIQGAPYHDGIGIDDRKEVYAEGVGLVYRLFNRVVYTPCNEDQCDNGINYKLQGHERHEELISYGNE
ncbi:hypothetical protein [Pontibacter pamirensis]|uniref:hypothetical protein n=1 Tax=Pontibacter pamirensis TaxID=2562824 RepID=UPI001F1EE8CA|nr:hypothetical protein [Pontibacter pamirensis]